MNRFALDTSVLLSWFAPLGPAEGEKSMRLRQEHMSQNIELVVLDQTVYELLHLFKESDQFDQSLIPQALTSLEYMHLSILPFSYEVAQKTIQIAREHDISTYAAGPVALGALLRCQAVTCDGLLYRKIASLPWTCLLANLNF